MKMTCQLFALIVLFCLAASCASTTPEQYAVRQKIPIEIQADKPVTIEIHSLSGNGANEVGIRCPYEVWNVLTNSSKKITVRLKSSNKPDTQVGGVNPGSGSPYFLGYVPNVHYLFYIGGQFHAKAPVEIIFPNVPPGVTHAEILIGKTPADTGL
jgi:hypothetical protein